MAGIAQELDIRLLRRVVRFRSLVAGPFAMNEMRHDPVMVDEVLDAMQLRPGSVVVDATLGLAGHAQKFVEAIAPLGTLVGLDWDAAMLEEAKARLGEAKGVRTHFFHSDYRSAYTLLLTLSLRADAFFADLGLNSAQVDDPTRGISFRASGVLDMRMDRSTGEPASAVLNRLSPVEIQNMLLDYGDERWAARIARVIVERRRTRPLRTTDDLVECVLAAIPAGARDKRIHPATRTFQAVRIYVNRELDDLEEAMRGAAATLNPGGRLVVLSYHSGEDRAVKTVFRELDGQGYTQVTRKPVTPSEDEIRRNPRSRSAKMRVLQRDP